MTALLTSDWTDADLASYVAFCASIRCADVTVPMTVWANESDNRTTAHDENGNASGLFQLEPETAKDLGYNTVTDPYLAGFREMSVTEQLVWATRYYGPHAGQLGSVGRLYTCTFLPVLIGHGDDQGFVLCAGLGPYAWAYKANHGFDTEAKGFITVADLVAAAERAVGPRTRELFARVAAAKAPPVPPAPPTPPESNPGGTLVDDGPVSVPAA